MKNNEPAFPNGEMENNISPQHYGLTKRELFAGLAMQGFCANNHAWEEKDHNGVAEISRAYADALLAELAKEVENEG